MFPVIQRENKIEKRREEQATVSVLTVSERQVGKGGDMGKSDRRGQRVIRKILTFKGHDYDDNVIYIHTKLCTKEKALTLYQREIFDRKQNISLFRVACPCDFKVFAVEVTLTEASP